MKLVAVESLLLAGLLFLSALVLWSALTAEGLSESTWIASAVGRFPEYPSTELLLAVILCVAVYWALQLWGRNQPAFWFVAFLVILPHGPSMWAHNRLEWYQFFGWDASLEAVHSQAWDVMMLLVSLVGLVVLYRVIGLRKLDRQLSSQHIQDTDRKHVMLSEALMLTGLVAAGLLLALLMVSAAAMLGRLDVLLEQSPWAVLTIGGGATFLFALTLVLWFRTRESTDAFGTEHTQRPNFRARRRRLGSLRQRTRRQPD